MLRIYLTNLGKYNEGELLGEWVELPVSQEELTKVFDRIQICHDNVDYSDECGNLYEEYFITDYETDIEGVEVGEYSNLNELNELAEQLDELEEDAQKAIQAMLLDGYTFNDALEKASNGDYTIYYNCDDMTAVAYEVVENCGYLNNVPDNVARYFDYESFGRDLDIEGKFYNIGGDMVELF
ncbi:MAG: antirestriction protein ArdA [Coprococcus sp.]